jgi:hypothetical protein
MRLRTPAGDEMAMPLFPLPLPVVLNSDVTRQTLSKFGLRA